MATTTPNYGWAVPTSTDLVKDGATAIETLGDAIDASMNTALGTKKAGMVLISTTDFTTGVASVTVNNVFTSSYRNYRLVLSNLGGSGAIQALLMRLRKSGTDNTSNIYYRQNISASSTSVTAGRTQSTSWTIGGVRDQGPMAVSIDIFSPQISTQKTNALGSFMQNSTSEPELISNGWQHDLATSADFDGVTIYPSSGSIYGYLYVFGYGQ